MAWDPKFQSWGLPEIHQKPPPPPPPPPQQQQRQESNSGRGLDLKLGGSAVPPGPSKRPRAPGNASQNAACLVDGCDADLSGCREYHRRHKVCEAHSKKPTVLVDGREQRFCQQCSRFHLLVEFDEVKRSCRKRLDGHNRRRRKPQPDPLHSASLFPAHQGAGFLSYQHVYSATSDPAWASIIKADEGITNQENRSLQLLESQHHSPPNSTFRIFKEGKQFPFLQDDADICNAASSSESCSRKMFADGAAAHVLDTDCALSLLSSPPQTLLVNLGPMVSADVIPLRQPLVQQFVGQVKFPGSEAPLARLSAGFSCPGMDAGQIGNIAVAGSSGEASATHLNCHDFYSGGAADGHSEALPFSWQ